MELWWSAISAKMGNSHHIYYDRAFYMLGSPGIVSTVRAARLCVANHLLALEIKLS